jgi:hypothetical protein
MAPSIASINEVSNVSEGSGHLLQYVWHIHQLAEAVTAGARETGADVSLWQVPELVPARRGC